MSHANARLTERGDRAVDDFPTEVWAEEEIEQFPSEEPTKVSSIPRAAHRRESDTEMRLFLDTTSLPLSSRVAGRRRMRRPDVSAKIHRLVRPWFGQPDFKQLRGVAGRMAARGRRVVVATSAYTASWRILGRPPVAWPTLRPIGPWPSPNAVKQVSVLVATATIVGLAGISPWRTKESSALVRSVVSPQVVDETIDVPDTRQQPHESPTTPPPTPRRNSPSAATRATFSDDTRSIQRVLNQYRDALSILDAEAVRAVWPRADPGRVQQEFSGRIEQNVEFEACRISAGETTASASCAGLVQFGFRARQRRPFSERKWWQFSLEKTADGWAITSVTSEQLGSLSAASAPRDRRGNASQ